MGSSLAISWHSTTKKGYVCWSLVKKRLFVSMDVHLRESEPLVPSSSMSQPTSTSEIPKELPNPKITGDMISSPSPLEVRRTSHSNAWVPLDRYGFPHDIAKLISYSNISATHRAFIASLDSVTLPKCWQVPKEDPKWNSTLEKNKTWEIVSLPPGKKAIGCKWVFTIKQTQEGKIDRYKACLVAKGYCQTYDIDYDETFAHVAKMSTVRTLIFLAVNKD